MSCCPTKMFKQILFLANFAFLQLLAQCRLTPIEVVDVAHKLDNSVGIAGAMAGRDSTATEVFSAVTQHFATYTSANSGGCQK